MWYIIFLSPLGTLNNSLAVLPRFTGTEVYRTEPIGICAKMGKSVPIGAINFSDFTALYRSEKLPVRFYFLYTDRKSSRYEFIFYIPIGKVPGKTVKK